MHANIQSWCDDAYKVNGIDRRASCLVGILYRMTLLYCGTAIMYVRSGADRSRFALNGEHWNISGSCASLSSR